jgi:hypothetical protein
MGFLLVIHTLCSSLQHVLSVLSLLCLLQWTFPAPRLTSSQLVAISPVPPALLTAASRRSHNRSCWPPLYSLGMDHIENISLSSSSIFASPSCRTDCAENIASPLLHCCLLQICCLATGVFAEPFPSNSGLCWLHSSCLEQICHSINSSNFTDNWV